MAHIRFHYTKHTNPINTVVSFILGAISGIFIILGFIGLFSGVSIISEYGWCDAILWVILAVITALIQNQYDESVLSKQKITPSTTGLNETVSKQLDDTVSHKIKLPSWAVIKKYHFFLMPVALIILILVLYNNFLFLDLIGFYRVEAYPECTLYCYILVSNENPCALYPCEVYKSYEDNEPYYHVQKIYFPQGTKNVSGQHISLNTKDMRHVRISSEEKTRKMILVNRKYTAAKNIASADITWEVILLILAFLDMLYLLYCFLALIRNNVKLNACDLYFKEACENIPDPVTHEPITDTHSYINALKLQRKN